MKEGALLKKFLLEYSKIGSRLFRNNVGTAWTSSLRPIRIQYPQKIEVEKGDIILKNARIFRSGFPKGASDLLGWTDVEVTQDMVGKKLAVFTAFEVKTGRLKATKEQDAFVRTVNEHGGIATIARSLDDIMEALNIFKFKYSKGDKNGFKH